MRKVKKKAPVEKIEVEEDLSDVPLFDADNPELDHLAVERVDPKEGFVGTVDPSATEVDLFNQYGGGTFKLRPRNSRSKYVKGLGTKTITIAGDPIFKSKLAESRYRRMFGIGGEEKREARNDNAAGGLSATDLLLIMEKKSEDAKREREEARQQLAELGAQRQREAEAAHQRQLEILRLDNQRREKELEVERQRMRDEAREREERAKREMEAERDRNREFLGTMVRLAKSEPQNQETPMKALLAGMKLARDLGGDGDGETDPLALLMGNLPEILKGVGSLAGAGAAPGILPVPSSTPADDAEGEDEEPAEGEGADAAKKPAEVPRVMLQGELAVKVQKLAAQLEARGMNPETALNAALDHFLAQLNPGSPAAPAPAAPASPAPPKPAPAAPAAPARAKAKKGRAKA